MIEADQTAEILSLKPKSLRDKRFRHRLGLRYGWVDSFGVRHRDDAGAEPLHYALQ